MLNKYLWEEGRQGGREALNKVVRQMSYEPACKPCPSPAQPNLPLWHWSSNVALALPSPFRLYSDITFSPTSLWPSHVQAELTIKCFSSKLDSPSQHLLNWIESLCPSLFSSRWSYLRERIRAQSSDWLRGSPGLSGQKVAQQGNWDEGLGETAPSWHEEEGGIR